MKSVEIAVSVPVVDSNNLSELAEGLLSEDPPFENRSLDGETMVTVIVTLTTLGIPYFKVWLNSRVAEKKYARVSIDGIRIDGYSEADVTRIYELVNRRTEDEGPDD